MLLFHPSLCYVFFSSQESSGERETAESVFVWLDGCSAMTCSALTCSAKQTRSLTKRKVAVAQRVSKSKVSASSCM